MSLLTFPLMGKDSKENRKEIAPRRVPAEWEHPIPQPVSNDEGGTDIQDPPTFTLNKIFNELFQF